MVLAVLHALLPLSSVLHALLELAAVALPMLEKLQLFELLGVKRPAASALLIEGVTLPAPDRGKSTCLDELRASPPRSSRLASRKAATSSATHGWASASATERRLAGSSLSRPVRKERKSGSLALRSSPRDSRLAERSEYTPLGWPIGSTV